MGRRFVGMISIMTQIRNRGKQKGEIMIDYCLNGVIPLTGIKTG
jgi:hypothetical protein